MTLKEMIDNVKKNDGMVVCSDGTMESIDNIAFTIDEWASEVNLSTAYGENNESYKIARYTDKNGDFVQAAIN